MNTRIGYEDMDRLLTYPHRDNLSGCEELSPKVEAATAIGSNSTSAGLTNPRISKF